MTKRVLGRGLDALIPPGRESGRADENLVRMVRTDRIRANPRQPRQQFDDAKLGDLARSIEEKGILEPLIVRPAPDGMYELVAGERRLRAALLAGRQDVPVLIRDYQDRETLEIALIENVQREDLNPVEEAQAYFCLSEEFGRTHAEISQQVGKDRSTVTNLMRLLRLPAEILNEVSRGTLSVGHARVLLSVEDLATQLDLARRIVTEGWNVRRAEKHVARLGQNQAPPATGVKAEERDREVLRVEEALRYALGTEVRLAHGPTGGRIEIRYENREELERILEVLGVQIH